jgi:hypothetical protein
MTRQLVYISGAITSAVDDEMAMFPSAAAWLREQGYDAFSPPEHDIPEASTNYDAWCRALSRDIAIITSDQCVGICVLDSFAKSKGGLLELFVAVSLNRPIVTLPHQPDSWCYHVKERVLEAQAVLWRGIDRSRFAHHTDIPPREISRR